jgi:hypothetical protein
MTSIATYTLIDRTPNNLFSKTRNTITVEPEISEALLFLQDELAGFRKYIRNYGVEKLKTTEEYLNDFILLGNFYKRFASQALKTPQMITKLLFKLNTGWNKNVFLKPIANILKNLILKIYYRPDNDASEIYDLNIVKTLSIWLEASGKYGYEASRIGIWERHFKRLGENKAMNQLKLAVRYAQLFTKEFGHISVYTKKQNVISTQTNKPLKVWQENNILLNEVLNKTITFRVQDNLQVGHANL